MANEMEDQQIKATAYCVKCKAKKEFVGTVVVKGERRMAKGVCPDCGTNVVTFLPKVKKA